MLAFCAAGSVAAIVVSWQHGAMLNYGDAVAHLHIARRVFDSHQPRLTQLGSVWLPLPHVLLIPFVQFYSWWASGIAGIIPSALAYLAACAGLYRLSRRWLPWPCAVLALAFFATNPNLLYLQTTAMTEPLFLCEMIWIALWLVEWRAALDDDLEHLSNAGFVSGHDFSRAEKAEKQRASKAAETLDSYSGKRQGTTSVVPQMQQNKRRALAPGACPLPILPENRPFSAACSAPEGSQRTNAESSLKYDRLKSGRLLWLIAATLVAAIFTRYDGWVIAFFAWASVGIILARRGALRSCTFWLASLLVVAAPAAWFIYNAAAFGDWLYFLRGPYSAKAIEMRTSVPGFPPHPGWHNPWVALIFFMKAVELDAAAAAWGNVLLALSVLGTVWAWLTERRRAFAWALLLWLPVPFYAYSVAYGSVPIFLPVWWPHSWYNLRYGMELLPALALGLGFAAQFIRAIMLEFKPRHLTGERESLWLNCATAFLLALATLNLLQMLRERPLVYVESTKNIDSRRPYENQIPPALRTLLAQRPGAVILMETSVDPQLVALTGIPLRQTINESDLEIYKAALAAPAAHAGLVLAFDGDEIDRAVQAHPAGLTALRRFTAAGQPSATIYISDSDFAQ